MPIGFDFDFEPAQNKDIGFYFGFESSQSCILVLISLFETYLLLQLVTISTQNVQLRTALAAKEHAIFRAAQRLLHTKWIDGGGGCI